MATKNRSTKKSRKVTFWQRLFNARWYVKLGTVIIFGLAIFFVFKVTVNMYNNSLFDKAEASMRAMDLPKSDNTAYKRYCSLRSVKFQSPGNPSCSITRTDTYNIGTIDEAVIFVVKNFYIGNPEVGTNEIQNAFDERAEYKIVLDNTVDGLECSQYVMFRTVLPIEAGKIDDYKSNTDYLVLDTACYKDVKFQLYPEY